MPARPPLSSTSPIARFGPAAAGVFVFGLMVALPAPPPRTARVESSPGEVWADLVVIAEGEVTAADEPKRVQKRPPCTPRTEIDWDGKCWMPHEAKPPCPPGLAEGAGKCLIRVPAPKPPNTSVGP